MAKGRRLKRAGRLKANRLGLHAEWTATLLMAAKGYRPLARNFKVQGGEIDLVAMRGRTIVFVEVKARPDMEAALSAISSTKRGRIERAARVWLTRNSWAAAGYVLRGDGVFVAGWHWPRHIENAFRLDLM